jgi:decaprenylphospho-beta-D-ribofuranose 2-oxidase
MALIWDQEEVINWSMTERSPCFVFKAHDTAEVMQALALARTRGLSVIPHGAGHSYTDAALNTHGVIIDLRSMHDILSWDPQRGIIQVEPGVTVHEIVQTALPNRWWLPVTPSTAEATVGGCVAMNVNGKNAWKCGSFGEHVLSLTVLLSSGEALTLSPQSDQELFQALVGSAGLLGMITSVTLQLQRIPSAHVDLLLRPATSLREILTLLRQEQSADFLEAWVDGFAEGQQLGRGIVTCATYSDECSQGADALQREIVQPSTFHKSDRLQEALAHATGTLGRPVVKDGMHIANSLAFRWCAWGNEKTLRNRSLVESTFYPHAAFTGYRALLPQGTETFQAFVPYSQAEEIFGEILRRSQEQQFIPLWCIIKRHRRDPFLLSYQVDGFSLEVNYHIVPRAAYKLRTMLRELMELVIVAGGKFYLAKDSLLTSTLYRRSVGEAAVSAFLQLKRRYDPDLLFQSNLYRRLFEPALCEIEGYSRLRGEKTGVAFDLY